MGRRTVVGRGRVARHRFICWGSVVVRSGSIVGSGRRVARHRIIMSLCGVGRRRIVSDTKRVRLNNEKIYVAIIEDTHLGALVV